MKHPIAAIAATLIIGISVPASSEPTISITQPGNGKAAAAAPLTYAMINSSHGSIMLVTSGGCGSYQRPMKPARASSRVAARQTQTRRTRR